MLNAPRGLVGFDLDGTLLRGSTVCELLADPLGRLEDMRIFERYTAERDITAARVEMATWYRGVSREKLLEALRAASWAEGAKEGIARLRRAGLEVAIVSITWGFAVAWFAEQVGVRRHVGTDLAADGNIGHVWPRGKGRWLSALAAELQVPADRVAAVGDSGGDTDLLGAASLPIFVGPAGSKVPPRAVHMPEASITRVVEHILAAWAG
jgi:phosphoserine phosphatase